VHHNTQTFFSNRSRPPSHPSPNGPFAQEAASMMFDDSGRLVCEPSLATAQALCLLQMHEWVSQRLWSTRYHGACACVFGCFKQGNPLHHFCGSADLALQIVDNLGVHKSEEPAVPPFSPCDSMDASIQRESAQRITWLVYAVDLMSSVYSHYASAWDTRSCTFVYLIIIFNWYTYYPLYP
jgi:hypothetical protein